MAGKQTAIEGGKPGARASRSERRRRVNAPAGSLAGNPRALVPTKVDATGKALMSKQTDPHSYDARHGDAAGAAAGAKSQATPVDKERERVKQVRDDLGGWRKWGP